MSETLSGSQEKSAFVIEGQIKLNFFCFLQGAELRMHRHLN